MTDALSIIEQLKKTHLASKEEILFLLEDQASAPLLFTAADEVRREFVGDGVYLRALIEISSYCKNNCCYCGLRRDNTKAVRYRLSLEQITLLAAKAQQAGYKTIVLQGGEDPWFTPSVMAELLREIKKLDLVVTLSLGEKTFEEYQAYQQAGANRYLLRIETTDKNLYERLDPGMSWENRLRCLQDLKQLGYEVGSGSLVGLPGQTMESLADDLLFFQKLPVDMAGIGPFIPHPDTPLGAEPLVGHFQLSLKMMALMRLLLPDINIPATTAMETLEKDGRLTALQCGANVVMPNITQSGYRKFYELYPGKPAGAETPQAYLAELDKQFRGIGRHIAQASGFHGEYLKNKTK